MQHMPLGRGAEFAYMVELAGQTEAASSAAQNVSQAAQNVSQGHLCAYLA